MTDPGAFLVPMRLSNSAPAASSAVTALPSSLTVCILSLTAVAVSAALATSYNVGGATFSRSGIKAEFPS